MASSLIRGKYVVARVASRTEVEVIPDGAVFQRDGVIVEIGPHADLAARHRPDEVLGSPDHVVVPSFVNAAALAELAASLREPLTPEEEGRRRLSREVFPVVKRVYDGWLDEDARVSFYRPSSRV